MINMMVNYIDWSRNFEGRIFVAFMALVFYFSLCTFESISEDVE